jgi:hypothetical protein
MTRLVRDFFEVDDRVSLDHMIDLLSAVRERLPEGARDARVQMRGDDVFGRRLTVSYLRPQTVEEAAREARYGAPVLVREAA